MCMEELGLNTRMEVIWIRSVTVRLQNFKTASMQSSQQHENWGLSTGEISECNMIEQNKLQNA